MSLLYVSYFMKYQVLNSVILFQRSSVNLLTMVDVELSVRAYV
jgi:hypothetical protein